MIIYLIVKQHKTTGLKYFCKHTGGDPYGYKGSGKYWKRHLKKHGNDVDTLYVWEFTDQEECTRFALEFSEQNNITESSEWANLRNENGLDGAPKGVIFSESHRQNISRVRKGKSVHTPESKRLLSIKSAGEKNPFYNKKHSEETKLIISNKLKNVPKESRERHARAVSATAQKKRKIKVDQYNMNPKRCACCNIPLDYDKRKYKYCSMSCSSTINNTLRKNI